MFGKKKSRLGRTFRHRQFQHKQQKTVTIIKEEKWTNFREWLKREGFPKTNLTLAEFQDTGRGMMATRDIKAGEVIISVPKKFLITYRSLTNLLKGQLSRSPVKLSAHQFISLYLILEYKKGSQSSIYPYINMLPKDFDNMPLNYNKELFNLLPHNVKVDLSTISLKVKVFTQRLHVKIIYGDGFVQKYQIDILYNLVNYQCFIVVNTRCIYLETKNSDDVKDRIAIAPLLDFLNHTYEAKIKGEFNYMTQCYEITTFVPYKRGDQVFINYGPHDNFFILMEYGFVIPNNPYNYVSLDKEYLEISLPGETELARQEKLDLLLRHGFYGDYSLRISEISFRLLTALRLRVIQQFDVSTTGTQGIILKWKNTITGLTEIINSQNEKSMYFHLQLICESALLKAEQVLEALKASKATHLPLSHVKLLCLKQISYRIRSKVRSNAVSVDTYLIVLLILRNFASGSSWINLNKLIFLHLF
ncbi:unnamed protein product [Rhizophagus irregularis]|nr:unnamed protein product [Rhizophagus irregularis]